MNTARCPACIDDRFCTIADAVTADDIDRAIALGLLDFEAPIDVCATCASRVTALGIARNERLRALAARERHRARQARLAHRAEVRARKRANAAAQPSIVAPPLPAGAAAALARAKARVAAKRLPE